VRYPLRDPPTNAAKACCDLGLSRRVSAAQSYRRRRQQRARTRNKSDEFIACSKASLSSVRRAAHAQTQLLRYEFDDGGRDTHAPATHRSAHRRDQRRRGRFPNQQMRRCNSVDGINEINTRDANSAVSTKCAAVLRSANLKTKNARRNVECQSSMQLRAPNTTFHSNDPFQRSIPTIHSNDPFQRSIPTIHSNDPFQRSIPFPRSNDANPSKTRTWLHRQVSTHRKACQSINVDKLKYHRRREFGADAVFCTDRTNAAPLTIDSALPFDEHQIGDAQSQSRTHAPTSTNPSATTRTWLS